MEARLSIDQRTVRTILVVVLVLAHRFSRMRDEDEYDIRS